MGLANGSASAQSITHVDVANPSPSRVVASDKVWTTLITNTKYLSGLLTLDASLKFVGSAYPLVVLYTDSFPPEGHAALDRRGIAKKHIPYLLPSVHRDYTQDPRFYDCWSKLTPFSLVEYARVVQLDSDMLVRKNMDELMTVPLDSSADAAARVGSRVFAASHACVCNPLKKPHYPRDWIASNCAFTTHHASPDAVDAAQTQGAPCSAGLAMPNGGLQVVVPSAGVYTQILDQMANGENIAGYDFADQSLLGDAFAGRWVALPYVYNALKTLRWKGVHDAFWRDDEVKNVHYILSPKPWDESAEDKTQPDRDASHQWWWDVNDRRLKEEKARGIDDGF